MIKCNHCKEELPEHKFYTRKKGPRKHSIIQPCIQCTKLNHKTKTKKNNDRDTLPEFPAVIGVWFRHCPGHPGLAVSSDGTVWTCIGRGGRKAKYRAHWSRRFPSSDTGGYLFILAKCQDGTKKNRTVHQLMLEAFIGPKPRGCEGCHNDGNRKNNQISNLRWDTKRNNQLDAFAHGTHNLLGKTGENHACAKFSDSQIIEIYSHSLVNSSRETAKKFHMSKSHVLNIRHRRYRSEALNDNH